MDFHESTLLYRKGASVFQSLTNSIGGEIIRFGDMENTDIYMDPKKPLLLSSMPGYLDIRFRGANNLIVKSIKTYPGSLINLKAYPHFESYLGSQFNNKKRSQFRSSRALMGHCFEIRHMVYFGAIEKREYERLFDALIEMHKARVGKKGSRDDTSGMWDLYRDSAYRQILDKSACISVIYHGNRPIAISLNFILGKIVHGFNRSFDMAYSKFGLGNIELLNMVQWCFEHGFEILDFMKGEYDYKNKFTDTSYNFTIQLAYAPESGQRRNGLLLYYGFKAFYALYNTARTLNLHKMWHKISRPKSIGSFQSKTGKVFISTLGTDRQRGDRASRLDWNSIKSPALRRAICDFCHKHKKPLNGIDLYGPDEMPNAIELISGSQMLLITENKKQKHHQSQP